MKKIITILILSLLTHSAHSAVDFGTPFDPDDLKKVGKVFGATTLYRQTNGPSELGTVWGVDAGIQASASQAKSFNAVVNTNGGDLNTPILPFAYAVIRGGAPYGIGGSFAFIPSVKSSAASASAYAFDTRWSWGYFFDFPFSADVRFHFSSIKISASGTITRDANGNAIPSTPVILSGKFQNYGLTSSVGKKWSFFLVAIEPYGGLGFDIVGADFSGSSSNFLASITQNNKFDYVNFHFLAGVDFTFFKYMQLDFEYDLIGTNHTFAVMLGVTI